MKMCCGNVLIKILKAHHYEISTIDRLELDWQLNRKQLAINYTY